MDLFVGQQGTLQGIDVVSNVAVVSEDNEQVNTVEDKYLNGSKGLYQQLDILGQNKEH